MNINKYWSLIVILPVIISGLFILMAIFVRPVMMDYCFVCPKIAGVKLISNILSQQDGYINCVYMDSNYTDFTIKYPHDTLENHNCVNISSLMIILFTSISIFILSSLLILLLFYKLYKYFNPDIKNEYINI